MEAEVAFLTRNYAHATGVRAMDDQHGILMDTTNKLRLALMHGANQSQMDELNNRLAEFMRMHIWSEEQLMEQTGFPGLAEHRIEHEKSMSRLSNFAHGKWRNQHPGRCRPQDLLYDWQVEHTNGLDQEYGPWMNERGIF
jgi:hemerythrin